MTTAGTPDLEGPTSGPPERSAAEVLATPVQYLKGVGPHRAELLERLGLHTARDVLFYFPRDYQDLTDQRDVDQLEEGKLQSVRGVVDDVDLRNTSAGRCILGVLGPLGQGLPAGDLVQPALHAGEVRLRAAGDALRQAEVRGPGLGDGPSAGGDGSTTKKRSRPAKFCPSIR